MASEQLCFLPYWKILGTLIAVLNCRTIVSFRQLYSLGALAFVVRTSETSLARGPSYVLIFSSPLWF